MSNNNHDRAIEVRTNAFRITQLPVIQYRQYDVVIQPELKNVRRRHEVIDLMQNAYPQIFHPRCIYDGRAILFAPTSLALQSGTSGMLDVSLGNSPRDQYRIKLTLASGAIDFQGLAHLVATGNGRVTPEVKAAVNLLQMILRQAASMTYPTKGRSIFTDKDRATDLGQGVQLIRGFFQSVRPIHGSIIINVDVANSAFYKPGILTHLAMEVLRSKDQRILQKTPDNSDGASVMSVLKHHFNKVLFQVNIDGPIGKRIRTIRGIKENAGNYRFTKRAGPDGQGEDVEMTVAEYYLQAYNIRLRFPRDFGVIFSPPGQELQIIPFELCKVLPGQPYRRKLDESQTRSMVDLAKMAPRDRLERIKNAVAPNGALKYSGSHFVTTAGVQLEHEPMKISGTMLTPPPMYLGNQNRLNVNNGSWNMLKKTVFKAATLNEPWVIINFTNLPGESVSRFVSALHGCCTDLGMSIPTPDPSRYAQVNSQQDRIDRVIQGLSRSGPPKFLLAILNKSDGETKAKLKRFADIGQWPIITQCVREDKFSSNLTPQNMKKLSQYCNNVALKINARLGGINYTVPLLPFTPNSKFMIIGMDVSHPPGGPRLDRPSVASLVFSTDPYGCQYQARYSVLRPRTEALGEDLKAMIANAIETFVKIRGPPESIICYRDGISEDELERTGATEIEIIKDTVIKHLAHLAKKYNQPVPPDPKLTFIVVTKRHHFGAFAIDRRDADERSGNLLPGFTTNEGMSTPGLSEFYLLSHGGLLGTSRPAHYVILRDENFGNNLVTIKKLSFALCHVYAKATRSVSIPAPVYYADLACLRATTLYFDPSLQFDGDDSTTDGNPRSNRQLREDFNLARWQQGFRQPPGEMQSRMYFL